MRKVVLFIALLFVFSTNIGVFAQTGNTFSHENILKLTTTCIGSKHQIVSKQFLSSPIEHYSGFCEAEEEEDRSVDIAKLLASYNNTNTTFSFCSSIHRANWLSSNFITPSCKCHKYLVYRNIRI